MNTKTKKLLKKVSKTTKKITTKSGVRKATIEVANKNVKQVVTTKATVISRTKMVQLINDSKGRFFTATHIDKENNPRTMNCIKSNRQASELGYIMVYSVRDKGYRNINPQTLTDLTINGAYYKARK